MRWARDLALGARLAVNGGREGWVRTALTSLGVGLGVAALLLAASIPTMYAALNARQDGREIVTADAEPTATGGSLLMGDADTVYRGAEITGRLVYPEGADAPVPPGLDRLPATGEMYVSPALAGLLRSDDGALLRPRLPYRVAGTIGQAGLEGPRELAYIAGEQRLAGHPWAYRTIRFGARSQAAGFDPVLLLLSVVMATVLLLPVAVFVAAATRFGGERRDRRLAALRLVGADGAMARRMAAGEALVTSVLGLVAGVGIFLAGRRLVELFTVQGVSFFASDVRPEPGLAVLVLLAMPVVAVGATLISLRRVIIEPLGVVRRVGGGRRRIWWRLALPAAGLALLYPLFDDVAIDGSPVSGYQVMAGVVLLLVGVTAVLPWLVDATVRRLAGFGPLSWQLAVRRLQLDGGTAARAVSGVAVAVAGGIALQILFGAVDDMYVRPTGADPQRNTYLVGTQGDGAAWERFTTALSGVPGTRSVRSQMFVSAGLVGPGGASPRAKGSGVIVTVAECAALREMIHTDGCADGDAFIASRPEGQPTDLPLPRPGQVLTIPQTVDGTDPGVRWRVPRSARSVVSRPKPDGGIPSGVYVTPGGIDMKLFRAAALHADVVVRPDRPDAREHLRNTAAALDPLSSVATVSTIQETPAYASLRKGLYLGVFALLLLLGASLLVGVVEQLRERRRLLAVLVAFGTRRSTLVGSVLWQTAVPVVLGMTLAVAAGLGLGVLLLKLIGMPAQANWAAVAAISGAGAAVVLLVTVLSLPALWRLMRPDGLQTE